MHPEQIYVLKADGTREPFLPEKLEFSLKRAGAGGKAVHDILEHLKAHIGQNTTTREIYKHAFELLHKEERPVAIKYSLKRAIQELGPSGFPFEDFVAEIFRQKGYTAETGKIVRGFCVEHEVDVIAWNKEKLIMVEAKFHNEAGIKSDLKVALYVKARFDDLRKMTFDYGTKEGKKRELTEGWLVTNTKFSTSAIEYGSCQGGLVMVGWNYPPVGNLHDLILESKLHPLTCLASLNGLQKKELLDQGVVLCKTIETQPDLLRALGLSPEKVAKVIEEIDLL